MNEHLYDDIINLPHHISRTRPQMARSDRAAQFAPFAALTGYHAATREAARFTYEKKELDESQKAVLDEKLQMVRQTAGDFAVTVLYFLPDSQKAGGTYTSVTGFVKKIDFFHHTVVMDDNTSIPVEDILDITLNISAAE